MFTGVGGPAGIALMAASGALLSGGISVASQKATTGEVDWRQAGIDTAAGALGGGPGAGAGAAVAVRGGSTVARHVAEGAVDGAASSAAGHAGSPGPHTPDGLLRSATSGLATGVAPVGMRSRAGHPSGDALLGDRAPDPTRGSAMPRRGCKIKEQLDAVDARRSNPSHLGPSTSRRLAALPTDCATTGETRPRTVPLRQAAT